MKKIFIAAESPESLQSLLDDIDIETTVEWLPLKDSHPLQWDLHIQDDRIALVPDRKGMTPPYLTPPLDLSKAAFKGALLLRMGDFAGAVEQLKDQKEARMHVTAYGAIAMAMPLDPETYAWVTQPAAYGENGVYYAAHNAAVLQHYLGMEDAEGREAADALFRRALDNAPNPALYVFTLRQYAAFLTEAGAPDQAERLLRALDPEVLTEPARYDWQQALLQVCMAQLAAPYDISQINEIKTLLRKSLEWEEQLGNVIRQAMVLADAAHVALLVNRYSEALAYINKALKIFQAEGLAEFYAEAVRKKGEILYSWAQSGQPQFYKSALESYQAALKYYTKDEAPYAYADIQHRLGIIYAEMPIEEKKRGIMAGLSMAAFHEALEIFTPDRYPYEYAAVCTHMGNALCRFPKGVHTDNYKKAIQYYEKALEVRTPDMPMERALTLLNYLEAFWHMRPENGRMDKQKWEDLRRKAEEILHLVDDRHITKEARRHLRLLDEWCSINS